MALQLTDLLAIDRGGTHYKITGQEIVSLVGANFGTNLPPVADIAARDTLAGLSIGDRVKVDDASADATVTSGWAIYLWDGAAWLKTGEQESLDVVVNPTNLGYTAAAANGTITNSNGTAATLPLADATNAGLFAPADFSKLALISVTAATDLDPIKTKTDFITVTAAVDLDALAAASHAAADLAGTATTNPLTITGQTLGFSIGQLAPAP